MAAPICTIDSNSTMIASRPALGMPASLKPMPANSAWMIATPITPCDTARMVAPASPENARSAPARCETGSHGPRRRAAARTETGSRRRTTDSRNWSVPTPALPANDSIIACKRLQIRRHLAQHRANIGVGQIPEIVELRADQRPALDLFGRGLEREIAGADLAGEVPDPFDRAQAEPCRGTDDDAERDQGENGRGRPRAAAETLGEPAEDRIERHRQHGAPGQDRHEGTDDQEGPHDQQPQQSEPDHELDGAVDEQMLTRNLQGWMRPSPGAMMSGNVAPPLHAIGLDLNQASKAD